MENGITAWANPRFPGSHQQFSARIHSSLQLSQALSTQRCLRNVRGNWNLHILKLRQNALAKSQLKFYIACSLQQFCICESTTCLLSTMVWLEQACSFNFPWEYSEEDCSSFHTTLFPPIPASPRTLLFYRLATDLLKHCTLSYNSGNNRWRNLEVERQQSISRSPLINHCFVPWSADSISIGIF